MKSRVNDKFKRCFRDLPQEIQEKVKLSLSSFQQNPFHPGLHFKRVSSERPVYAIRITLAYRAVGRMVNGELVWFWVGSHKKYERLLKRP